MFWGFFSFVSTVAGLSLDGLASCRDDIVATAAPFPLDASSDSPVFSSDSFLAVVVIFKVDCDLIFCLSEKTEEVNATFAVLIEKGDTDHNADNNPVAALVVENNDDSLVLREDDEDSSVIDIFNVDSSTCKSSSITSLQRSSGSLRTH